MLKIFYSTAFAYFLLFSSLLRAEVEFEIGAQPILAKTLSSNDSSTSAATGFRANFDVDLGLGSSSWYIGARSTLINKYVTSHSKIEDHDFTENYDHRILIAGPKITKFFYTYNQPSKFYLTGLIGRGFSKLEIDETADRFYSRAMRRHIQGWYKGIETGVKILMRRRLSLEATAFYHQYEIDQSSASGSIEASSQTEFGIVPANSQTLVEQAIDDTVIQDFYGLGIGLSILLY